MTSRTTPSNRESLSCTPLRRRTMLGLAATGAVATGFAAPLVHPGPAHASQAASGDSGDADFASVWEDTFDGAALDPAVWEYELGNIRGNEQQHYSSNAENVRVEDGKLLLAVTERPPRDRYRNTERHGDSARLVKYNSGSIRTHGRQDFLFGKLELRARMPKGKGVFPALWLLGHEFHLDGRISTEQGYEWPSTGELDIAEVIGAPTNGRAAEGEEGQPGNSNRTLYGTPHFWHQEGDPDGDGNASPYSLGGSYTTSDDLNDNFHVFGVNRTPEKLEWLFDGRVYRTLYFNSEEDPADLDRREAARAGLNRPSYLQINLAAGGNWGGDAGEHLADDDTKLVVDWVKFSQTAEQKRQDAAYRADMPVLSGARDVAIRQGELADLVADVSVDRDDHVVELSINDSPMFVNSGAPGGRNEVRLRVRSADDAEAVASLPVGVYALYYTAMPRNVDLTGGQEPSALMSRVKATLAVLPEDGVTGDPWSTVGSIGMPEGFAFQDPGMKFDQNAKYLMDFVNPHDPIPAEERPTWTFTLAAPGMIQS